MRISCERSERKLCLIFSCIERDFARLLIAEISGKNSLFLVYLRESYHRLSTILEILSVTRSIGENTERIQNIYMRYTNMSQKKLTTIISRTTPVTRRHSGLSSQSILRLIRENISGRVLLPVHAQMDIDVLLDAPLEER